MVSDAEVKLVMWRPPLGGVLGALVFWAASLTPSLLPRPWYFQGAVSGVAIALGYGLGSAMAALARPVGWRPTATTARRIRVGLVGAGAILVAWAGTVHHLWQSDVRRLMGMEPGVWMYLAGALLTAVPVGYVLVVVARLIRRSFQAYVRLLGRVMSTVWSRMMGVITVVLVVVVVSDVLIGGRVFTALNEAYLASDRRFDVDVVRPESPLRAGSPASLIAWEAMGRQGRSFVTAAPSLKELESFNGQPAVEPIRIYAGLQAAETAQERAEVALAELERTGAFDRDVIVVIAPTGTGWIDPYAVDPLEYMYNGDTASVAIQYSHLPSWVLMIGNQDRAVHAARALFEAVENRLAREPASERPRIVLYGQSLGSFGLEAVFDGIDDVKRRTDGVLWVGPPRSNRLWRDLMARRQADSPIWRPVYQNGETVRFGPDGRSFSAVGGPWNPPRVAYLQHPSDPITWLSLDVLFERPKWMSEPRGPDVSRRMPYIPIVTFWQLAVDLAMGTNAPPGHGHKFGDAQAEAWALILPPDNWTPRDTGQLREVLAGHNQ